MKPTVIILHGIGGHAGIHWQQWLHDELAGKGYPVIMPTLPQANHPDRSLWKKTITDLAASLDEVIFVGHSLAVPSILDAVEDLSGKKIKLVSVSGFCSDYGAELNSYFLKERTVDFAKARNNIESAVVFYGDNDPYVPQDKLMELAVCMGVTPIIIPQGGHLNTGAGFTQFPLLLEQVQALA